MKEPSPAMHICKNCGFMSPRRDLFIFVDGFLQCIFCVEQYSELLTYLKPSKTL